MSDSSAALPTGGQPAPAAPPAAPTAAPPAAPPPPAPKDNKKTVLIVGAVVGAITLFGVVGAVVAAAGSDEPAAPAASNPLEPGSDPNNGPQPEPAPDPAPAPGPAPSDPVSPPPTEPPAEPDPAEQPSGGSQVDIGNGIGFSLPAGWQQDAVEPGFAQVSTEGGYFVVEAAGGTDIETLIAESLQGLIDDGVQELAISKPEAISLPTSNVVSAATLSFEGLLATQQSGMVPVEGAIYFFALQDGTGVSALALFGQGGLDPLAAAYDEMLNSLISSL